MFRNKNFRIQILEKIIHNGSIRIKYSIIVLNEKLPAYYIGNCDLLVWVVQKYKKASKHQSAK